MPPTTRMRSTTGTPKSKPSNPSPPSANSLTVRAKALDEVIGMLCMPLIVKAAQDEAKLEENQISPYHLDLYVIGENKNAIISGVLGLADTYPVVGALIDKLGVVGPVGALAMVAVNIGAQIAENHNVLPKPVRATLPIVDRDELAQQVKSEAAKASSNGNASE